MEENHAQTKIKVHFKALYESTRIGGPNHKSIQPPRPSKMTLLTNQRQIQGSKGQMTHQTKQNFRGTQRGNSRAHLSVVQMKEALRGRHLGAGRPTGLPEPLLGPNRPIFGLQTPTALLILAPDGFTSEVYSRIHPWRAI